MYLLLYLTVIFVTVVFVCNHADMLSKFAIEHAVTWILGIVRFFGSTQNRTERTDTKLGRFHVF